MHKNLALIALVSSEGLGSSKFAHIRQGLPFLHTGSMDIDEGYDQNLNHQLLWICQHGVYKRYLTPGRRQLKMLILSKSVEQKS